MGTISALCGNVHFGDPRLIALTLLKVAPKDQLSTSQGVEALLDEKLSNCSVFRVQELAVEVTDQAARNIGLNPIINRHVYAEFCRTMGSYIEHDLMRHCQSPDGGEPVGRAAAKRAS